MRYRIAKALRASIARSGARPPSLRLVVGKALFYLKIFLDILCVTRYNINIMCDTRYSVYTRRWELGLR